jgi:NAD+ kinase
MSRRVGLIARHTLRAALQSLAEAASWLDAHGCVPVIDEASATAASLDGRWRRLAREALPAAVEVLIAFGGDGTLLDTAGVVMRAGADVPVLGVNLGRLGFLTEVGRTEVFDALEAWRSGRTRTETRLMLRAHVDVAGGNPSEHLALNDVVVSRGARSRMIEIDVAVDDERVCQIKADGVIVASATGSTAYNLSAGGPIVLPEVDALLLTPIAPHTLTIRPLVLPASATVTLRPMPDVPSDILVTFDGQLALPLGAGDVVTIRRAPNALRLVRASTRTHFDMLREKLKWGHQ